MHHYHGIRLYECHSTLSIVVYDLDVFDDVHPLHEVLAACLSLRIVVHEVGSDS